MRLCQRQTDGIWWGSQYRERRHTTQRVTQGRPPQGLRRASSSPLHKHDLSTETCPPLRYPRAWNVCRPLGENPAARGGEPLGTAWCFLALLGASWHRLAPRRPRFRIERWIRVRSRTVRMGPSDRISKSIPVPSQDCSPPRSSQYT